MLTQTRNLREALALLTLTAAAVSLFPSPARAQDIWSGNAVNWTNPNSWQAALAPLPGDSLTFTGSTVANNNNFPAGTAFDGITFDSGASGFNLAGNSVLISGSSATNVYGIINQSGFLQTVSLNLSLDAGYYLFDDDGNGLTLNGTLAAGSNGLAFFAGNVKLGSLTPDSSGLIPGLDGQALIYNGVLPVGTTGEATGLATVVSGVVQPYSAYTTVAPAGSIPSGAGNNIEFTNIGSSGTYNANGTTVNTITSTQTGVGAGTATDTIANTGTLTLGNKGGIYVLGSAAGAKGCFLLNGGNLTAGTTGTPATIVLGVNGTTSGNQSEINAVIQDNATNGPVTVVTTGNGSQFFNKANTYTGGTFVTEGQLQATTSPAVFGTGPVFVASGATVYSVAGGTYANNFSLSPGLGDTSGSAAIANPGALVWATSGIIYSGKITLLGPIATNGHGDRISGNVTGGAATLSGQITGSGTLEFGGAHTESISLANTNTNALNNWQGGLILNANTGVAVNTEVNLKASNQLPSGPNAGNVTLIPATSAVYARLNLNGFNATINGLVSTTGGAEAIISDNGVPTSAGNSILTLGANDTTASFAGTSTDGGSGKALSLVKIGNGTQTFLGNLGHSGNTTVSNGTFFLSGTIANSSNIIVGSAGTFDASSGPSGGLSEGVNQTLSGTGTVVGSTSVSGTLAAGLMAVSGASTNIGALTNNGNVTLNGGATNIWSVINAAGAVGTALGSSELVVINGSLTLNNANASTPIHLKLVSLTASGSPGNATFNQNVSQSWKLAQTPNQISGYTDPSQFSIDASAFSNLPAGASQFSVSLSPDGTALVLNYTSAQVITTALVNQTNSLGTTASFTVTATGGTPITFQWVQQGTFVLVNTSTSLGGAGVTITTNGAGTSSTLTLTGVRDADAGAFIVNVTNHAGSSGSSGASLTVIDPPANLNINTTGEIGNAAGGIIYLTATAGSGTAPFTYIWSFNGTVLTNTTIGVLPINVSPATVGSYSVVASNSAGLSGASPVSVINPVTSVPNQIIYEPFDSYAQMSGPSAPFTWQGVTNIFNQATGEGADWFHSSGANPRMVIESSSMSLFTVNGAPGYPWPGLAGDSTQDMYHQVNSSQTDNDQLQFAHNGFSPGQSVYVSFVFAAANTGTANVSDCIAAFNAANQGGAGTSFNLKLSTQVQTDGTYWLGLSKGNGNTGASQGVDANTAWVTGFQALQDVFVVAVYQINSGLSSSNDDTVALWINPDRTTYGTTNIPTPTVAPSTFGGVPNSGIHTFVIHGTQLPGTRYYSDLRIGTTWASVTPPSGPALRLANQVLTPGSNVVFASQNAGNPALTYAWYFRNTNGTALANGLNPTGDGSVISGSTTSTLTISGATALDFGNYIVVASNTDLAPADSGATLTGSATATLSAPPLGSPTLTVSYQAPNVVLSWPATFNTFTLEQTTSLSPTNWTLIPTNNYVVSGTNLTYATNVASGTRFYQLIH